MLKINKKTTKEPPNGKKQANDINNTHMHMYSLNRQYTCGEKPFTPWELLDIW